VSKLNRDKELAIAEIHNRIKKLLIEEERAARKIEETRRKAMLIAEIQGAASAEKAVLNKDISQVVIKVKDRSPDSPKAQDRVREEKRKIVVNLKKES